jgi:uncharacterized protein
MTHKGVWEIGATAALLLAVGGVAAGFFYQRERQRRLDRELAQALDLAYTTQYQETDQVRRLVSLGASVRVQGEQTKLTILPLACYWGDQDLVARSLDAGADVNARDPHQFSPLLLAAYYRHPEIVRMLATAGARVDVEDWRRRTALIHAAAEGYTEMVRTLIAVGANLEAADDVGRTGLVVAIDAGHLDTARALIAAGAQVNTADGMGFTPLMYVVGRGDVSMARLLLQAGARVHHRSRDGSTALHWARNAKKYEVYAYHRKHGGLPRSRVSSPMIRLLKQHGAKE